MAGSAQKPQVMVVDDDNPTRMMATEFLSQAGFDVVEFASGELALESLGNQTLDLIVLDVEMPGLDGFDVCRLIRTRAGFENTPILMLTGLDNTQSIELAFEAGATDFGTKPINWMLLCHRLRYMLRAKQSAEDLIKNQKSLASAQRIARMGNWQIQISSGDMVWSDQLCTLLGDQISCAEPSLQKFLKPVHVNDINRVKVWFDEVQSRRTDNLLIDFYMVPVEGEGRYYRQQVEQVLNKEGEVVELHGVLQDVSEHQRAQHRINQLANYDRVTGIPNRTLFQESVEKFIGQSSNASAAVLYIDIDDFKQVNDTLGHASGDVMLNEVVLRINKIVPDDCTLARMGADEFTLLMPLSEGGVDPMAIASDINHELSEPFALNDGEIFSSCSVGVAIYPDHATCADTLLKNADMAMTSAKRAGKNTFRDHNEDMDEEAQNRFRIESQMRGALERHEFQLFYQPQVDLQSGKMYCAEALIRWVSPELGFVSPDQFIYIAEDNGFIVPLGEWVLRTACLQAVEWIAGDFPIQQVAVNISALQFMRPNFSDTVQRILDETGLSAEHLELEITESLLAKDTNLAIQTLRNLKEIGVQLSIDDFGTGYSSLSQLKHFPIDRLKLDQSFVQGVTNNKPDAAITRAVIAMSSSMNVKLLAEGVETLEQLEYLKANACNEIQGYFISKPVPADLLAENIDDIRAHLSQLFDGSGNLRLIA